MENEKIFLSGGPEEPEYPWREESKALEPRKQSFGIVTVTSSFCFWYFFLHPQAGVISKLRFLRCRENQASVETTASGAGISREVPGRGAAGKMHFSHSRPEYIHFASQGSAWDFTGEASLGVGA